MTSPEATVSLDRCPLCDAPLEPNATACPRCDWVPGYRQRHEQAGNIEARDLVAAFLSFIPGLGHFYKGHSVAGTLFMIGALLVFLPAYVFFMFFGPLLIPVYWFWVIFQAYWVEDLKVPHPAGTPQR
jgi:TM2 domain-containing membrane protein YozV